MGCFMKGRKRESILNTARQMFIRYGIRKTNLNEIALMARVAKATIYNYFGSKEQVYYEVLNREANELMDKVNDAVSQIKSPLEKLRVFYLTRFAKMAEMSNILNMEREGGEYLKTRTSGVCEGLFKREVHIVETILEEGAKQGIFRSDNIMQPARVIGYALKGLEGTFPTARSHIQY